MNICGLLLAAGGSSRLGRPKQLITAQGKTLLEHAVGKALETSLQQVYVVLGAHYENIAPLIRQQGASLIKNEQWQEGMGSSISTGIRFIQKERPYDAVLIMLCDQLHVNPPHLQALIDAYRQKEAPIIATSYNKQTGVPALFGQQFFNELEKLSGDTGARKLLNQNSHKIYAIQFEKAIIDIDTQEDMRKNGLA